MINFATDYQHHIEGRLRIKVTEIKRRGEVAASLERELRDLAGVTEATANPVTGNVLVLYHPQESNHHAIIERIRGLGMLRHTTAAMRRRTSDDETIVQRVAKDLAVAACGELIKLGVRAAFMAVL